MQEARHGRHKGKLFYSLLIAFICIALVLIASLYLFSFHALRQASLLTQNSLETLLTSEVERMGEQYTHTSVHEMTAAIAADQDVLELAEASDFPANSDTAARVAALLKEYEDAITFSSMTCYLYFVNSGWLLSSTVPTLNSIAGVDSHLFDHIELLDAGRSQKQLGVAEDGTYYDLTQERLSDAVYLISISYGTPSYTLPESFTRNLTDVEMYTYDRFGNNHPLEESKVLRDRFTYDSLGENDTDTLVFTFNGHSYVGTYYTFSTRPIRLAVFCRDTSAESMKSLNKLLLVAILFLTAGSIAFAFLFSAHVYKPIDSLVSHLPYEEENAKDHRIRDDVNILQETLSSWSAQLRQQNDLIQELSSENASLPDAGQLNALSTSIEALDERKALEQLDLLLQPLSCQNRPGQKEHELIFALVRNTVSLAVLETELPGDINRNMASAYSKTIREADSMESLVSSVCTVLNAMREFCNPSQDDEKLFQKIRTYIQENFTDPNLSADTITAHFSVNASALSRLFRKYNQSGFLEYVHQLRVQKASELIRETDRPLTEIADAVGFTNFTTMNRAFKKYTSTTPGKLREK